MSNNDQFCKSLQTRFKVQDVKVRLILQLKIIADKMVCSVEVSGWTEEE